MSFGGGVQSTAIAMLAINRDERLLEATGGVLPELYLFADTGDEPEALYPHVLRMKARIEGGGADFVVLSRGKLSLHIAARAREGRRGMDNPPVFMWSDKFQKYVPSKRGCTASWKSAVMDRFAKDIYKGASPPVQHWYGISKDEQTRERVYADPKDAWRVAEHPLLRMNWHRADCINYLNEIGVTAMKSACVFCPYHSHAQWRDVQSNPNDWKKAVELERVVQASYREFGHFAGLKQGMPFFSEEGVPLGEADFSKVNTGQTELWDNECVGVCGV